MEEERNGKAKTYPRQYNSRRKSESEYGKHIKVLRTDNKGELASTIINY